MGRSRRGEKREGAGKGVRGERVGCKGGKGGVTSLTATTPYQLPHHLPAALTPTYLPTHAPYLPASPQGGGGEGRGKEGKENLVLEKECRDNKK